MTTKVIVSYDGTDNDRDALALGRLFAQAGASLELAYVRHSAADETEAQNAARRGSRRSCARATCRRTSSSAAPRPKGCGVWPSSASRGPVVFGSEYRTAKGHVDPQNSARRLIEGGPIAVALAPAGFASDTAFQVETVGAIGEDGDPCVLETADRSRRASAARSRRGRRRTST